LFALVLGFGYIYNSHVRVDLIRERLPFRKKAWLEFLGSSLFMIPYCLIVIYFAIDFTYESYKVDEISASTVGLTHRWIIKSVLVIGLCVAAVAGFAVWLQSALLLFGPKDLRFHLMAMEWPEEESRIEGKKRITLDSDDDKAEAKPAAAPATVAQSAE
jgi:TRAP-type mannitol/chloroaromatic compound transport system permease small subunit